MSEGPFRVTASIVRLEETHATDVTPATQSATGAVPRSKRAAIEIASNHRLVQITKEIDWTELEELVQAIRLSKLKNAAGRPPHL